MIGTSTESEGRQGQSARVGNLMSCITTLPKGIWKGRIHLKCKQQDLRHHERQPSRVVSDFIHDQCTNLINDNDWRMPTNKQEGISLYFKLLENVLVN